MSSAAKHLSEFRGFAHRQELTELDGITIIDDTYNASPDSMTASLSILDGFEADRKIAVLADMKELGEKERQLHADIGEFINSNVKLDVLITLGDLAREIALKVDKNIIKKSFDNINDLEEFISGFLRQGDVCLLKGSNSMKLFEIVDKIKNYG